MGEKLYNQIVLCTDKYNDSYEKMFEEASKLLRILLDAGYLVLMRYDEPALGVLILEFENDDRLEYLGVPQPMWVTPSEETDIIAKRDGEGD